MKKYHRLTVYSIIACLLAACGPSAEEIEATVRAELDREATATAAALPTNTPTPTDTPIPTHTPEPTETPLPPGFEPVAHNADWEPITQDFDGVQMALVPAGCFMMGNTEEEVSYAIALCGQDLEEERCESHRDQTPQHEVCFEEPFWIDVYEVTNAQYGSSGEWPGDNLPRETVNWFDAAAHCESRGARLPTEAELEYAARGPDGLVYPWGDDFVLDFVVFWENSGEQTANVGSRPEGISWVGAYDMSGNVWEWAADWYDEDYYSTLPELSVNPQGPDTGNSRGARGGGWYAIVSGLWGANRLGVNPDNSDSDLGFRCALSE